MVQTPTTLDLKTEKVCMKKQIVKAKKLLKKMQFRIEKKLATVDIEQRDSAFYLKINEFRQHETHLTDLISILRFDEKNVKHFHIDVKKPELANDQFTGKPIESEN